MNGTANSPVTGTPDHDAVRWTHGWRRVLLATGMFVYPIITAIGVSQHSSGGGAVAGYAIVAAFCASYVMATISFVRHFETRFWVLLGVMAALCFAELPFAKNNALYLWAVIVSSAAIVARKRLALVIAGGALVSLLLPWAISPWLHNGSAFLETWMVVFTSLTVYGFAEMAATNRALVEARAEVARLASEAERNRIARDLHDLLGHSLTAITVKSGLARRLSPPDSRSLQEITEVERLSRQALSDVRAAVSGYRDVSLAGELARGRELLRAAGVIADLPSATDMVDEAHQELFGWAVREGLTNVVRHAHATRCTITLSRSQVEIRDDGPGGGGAFGSGGVSGGNGLAGLRERVAASGGTVEAGPLEPQGWRLAVSVAPKAGGAS